MQATQTLWHVAAFFIPALVLGGLSSLAVRLVWRRRLAGTRLWRLWGWTSAAAAVTSLVGLIAFGSDGRMATYGAMVVACAAALWWSAFRPAARRV